MPPIDQRTIDCPQCGQPTDVDLWQVLDLAREPELRRRFLQGQINALHCNNCGAAGMLPAPLAIHDPAAEQIIFFIPDDPQITPEMAGQIQADLGNALLRDWRGPQPNYLFTPRLSRDLMAVAGQLAAGLEPQSGPVSETGPLSTEPAEPTTAPSPELIDALLSFINARSLTEKQQIVETQQELLLSEQVGPVFEELLEQYQTNEQAVQQLQMHRTLLRRCRVIGIPAAFAELVAARQQTNQSANPPPGDLRAILTQLTQLTQLSDMPRRVELCRQALAQVNRAENEQLWAALQGELGNSLQQNPQGRRAENLEQAIHHYTQALEVYTRAAFPEQWATTQNNLANAYRNRIKGSRADNIEQAIHHYAQALEVRTRAAFPEQWATTQNNLANAYRNRIKGSRADNIEQAIHHYAQALEVYTRAAFPADHRQTQRNLGNLLFGERRWLEAQSALKSAIDAGRDLLAVAVTDEGRRAEVAETAQLFARSAFCQLRQGQAAESLLTLEQGKTRLLTEALALSGANMAVLTAAQQYSYKAAVEQVRGLEAELRLPADTPVLSQIEGPGQRHEREVVADLTQARADLNTLIETIRQEQPDFMPTGLNLDQLLALIPPGGALVAPLITSQGSAVFVIPEDQTSQVLETCEVSADWIVWLDEFTDDDLRELLQGPDDISEWGGWLGAYFQMRQNWQGWLDAIETIGDVLRQKLIGPIVQKLNQLGVTPGSPLLLLPQGGLGLLPLHAALLDEYPVTFAPSGYALHAARQRLGANGDLTPSQPSPGRGRNTLLAVVNPTGDLPFTPAEGDAIAALFDPAFVTRLDGGAATLNAINHHLQPATCHLLHFSGHGFYNWREAMQSGLVLADGPLTLSRLISQADLGAVRLVTLSACETGITDIRQSLDEFLGLPAGLMQAGAPAVVSTLWAVNDLSTMLLMERFYQHYLQDGLPLPEALRRAQLWLRDDVTAGKLVTYFDAEQDLLLNATKMPAAMVNDQFVRFATLPADSRPFSHPYYWAAFTFSGV